MVLEAMKQVYSVLYCYAVTGSGGNQTHAAVELNKIRKDICYHHSVWKDKYFTYKFVNNGFDNYSFIEKRGG